MISVSYLSEEFFFFFFLRFFLPAQTQFPQVAIVCLGLYILC